MLLLHEFEQPHALVGTGYRERKEGEEGKNDSTHGEEEKKVENEMKKMGRKCARVRGFGPKTGDFALLPGTFPPDEGGKRRSGGAFLLDESKDLLRGGRKGDSRRETARCVAGRGRFARGQTAGSAEGEGRISGS